MRHVFSSMGTVASVDLPDADDVLLSVVREIFRQTEARFSLFDPASELSRVASGQLALSGASAELRDTYARAVHWRNLSGGAFTPHRPDGVIDLNGIVKAEAIATAGDALSAAGCQQWSVNLGGDLLIARDAPEALRSVGLADPRDDAALLAAIVLDGGRRAVASSGSAQRGDHIWRSDQPVVSPFLQVTVVADDIVTADVLATAIVAGGPEALDALSERFEVDIMTVDHDGRLLCTPGLRRAFASAEAA